MSETQKEVQQEPQKKKSSFNLFVPFKVISKQRMSFFLWIAFSLFGGAIGIIVNIVRHWLFEGTGLCEALAFESRNGAFYTYSIALIAAVLSSVFVNFVEKKEVEFRKFKLPVITIAVYLLFFGGVMYTLFMNDTNTTQKADSVIMTWVQIVIIVCAVFLSIYSFCICRMDSLGDMFNDVKDHFYGEENENADSDFGSVKSNLK